jgi:hypothetical protein
MPYSLPSCDFDEEKNGENLEIAMKRQKTALSPMVSV